MFWKDIDAFRIPALLQYTRLQRIGKTLLNKQTLNKALEAMYLKYIKFRVFRFDLISDSLLFYRESSIETYKIEKKCHSYAVLADCWWNVRGRKNEKKKSKPVDLKPFLRCFAIVARYRINININAQIDSYCKIMYTMRFRVIAGLYCLFLL